MFMQEYLRSSEIIDWQNPEVLELALAIASEHTNPVSIAKACFEWVRDRIHHSVDYQMNPVTCRASDVLKHKTGYCFAKSHLLAALLRANGLPTGFCYQRLSIDDCGAPYSLHGFNAVCLPEFGWYRVDPRGNRQGVNAQFIPPREQLASRPKLIGEVDFLDILAEPLPFVIEALDSSKDWDDFLNNLPDISMKLRKNHDLVTYSS
jgi:hypothetical protein